MHVLNLHAAPSASRKWAEQQSLLPEPLEGLFSPGSEQMGGLPPSRLERPQDCAVVLAAQWVRNATKGNSSAITFAFGR